MSTITPVQVRLREVERAALDTYRRQKTDPPTRAQAMRELIQLVLLKDRIDNDAVVAAELGRIEA